MNALRFAGKRLLSSPGALLLALLLSLLPLAALHIGREMEMPPAGFFLPEDADEEARHLAELLAENGFLAAESAESLTEDVAFSRLDAGVFIPADLGFLLREKIIRGCLGYLRSDASLHPALWQEYAAAALFECYAPYLTAEAMQGSGISEEEIFTVFSEKMAKGDLFSFVLRDISGTALPEETYGERLAFGALALFLWIAIYFAAVLPAVRDARKIEFRIGRRKALFAVLLPQALLRALLFCTAALLGAILLKAGAWYMPLVLYSLSLLAFGLILTALPGQSWQNVFAALMLPLGLALCPIFSDLTLIYPLLGKLRHFHPVYWLWVFAEKKGELPVLPAGLVFAAVLILCFRQSHYIHNRFKKDLL